MMLFTLERFAGPPTGNMYKLKPKSKWDSSEERQTQNSSCRV